jgi:hypothetical protein
MSAPTSNSGRGQSGTAANAGQANCHICGKPAPYGFSARGFGLALLRWFCPAHKSEGQTYWRQANG